MKIGKAKGFTLIEILVAMTLVAILLSLGLVSYQGSKKAARDGKRKADLEQIRSALEIYRSDCKTYPQGAALNNPLTGVEAACSGNTYMAYVPADPGNCAYAYSSVATPNSYTICASLENGGAAVAGCVAGSCGTGCTCNYKVVNP